MWCFLLPHPLPPKCLLAPPTPQCLGQKMSATHPGVPLLFISDVFLCCSQSWNENTRILKTKYTFFSYKLKKILPLMPSLIAKVQSGTEARKEQPQGKQLVSTGAWPSCSSPLRGLAQGRGLVA